MAFEADCGSSTVLEEIRVASTAGFPVPGECGVTGRPRPSRRGPPQQRHADWGFRRRMQVGGRQIRNSKFEIPRIWPVALNPAPGWVGGGSC